MFEQSLTDNIIQAISSALEKMDLQLVEARFMNSPEGRILRLLVDRKEGGISLGECAQVNEAIGALLDSQDLIKDSYILEVSSPGLDRPLSTKNDFLRCLNKKAVFFLKERINDRLQIEGVILGADENAVRVNSGEADIDIPFSLISKAKQLLQ